MVTSKLGIAKEIFPIFWNTIISLYFYNWKFIKVKRQLLENDQLSD